MVRVRQIVYQLGQSLSLVPLLFVLGAVALSRSTITIDARLDDDSIPLPLTTTVEGGRAILTAVAGGLITSVTLLLSLILVAVQLASSQFSPRTLHDWTGDRTQQITIGLVLGTSVYCLLVLRETSVVTEQSALIPHLSVLLALVLGVLSLIAVVRYVDHLTRSLRVGSVARSITEQTIDVVHRRGENVVSELSGPRPTVPDLADRDPAWAAPIDAVPVLCDGGGWVQQLDEDRLLSAVPEGTTTYIAVSVGDHVLPGAPLVHVAPPFDDDEGGPGVRAAFALGPERTMQEDVGYGIMQLVDVAVRALSPGVNDPNTANDMIVNLGTVLLAYWSYPEQPMVRYADGRSLVRPRTGHREILAATFGPLRRYGAADPSVVTTMIRMLITLRDEIQRRDLPGPVEPISEEIDHVFEAFLRADPPAIDVEPIQSLVSSNAADQDVNHQDL